MENYVIVESGGTREVDKKLLLNRKFVKLSRMYSEIIKICSIQLRLKKISHTDPKIENPARLDRNFGFINILFRKNFPSLCLCQNHTKRKLKFFKQTIE